MQVAPEPGRSATVGDLLRRVESRPTPAVAPTASLFEVMNMFHGCPHSRSVYVVDDSMDLLGAISLDKLVRHAFSHSHEPRIHGRGLLGLVAHETAQDLMRKRPFSASVEEQVGPVLERMIARNVTEAPVLNSNGAVVGDITLIDLLEFLMEEDAENGEGEEADEQSRSDDV